MPYGSEALYRQQFADENGIIGFIGPLREQPIEATPFDKWNREKAINAINQNVPELHSRALAFYHGDHWQSSWGWIGPHPDPVLDADKPDDVARMWNEIQVGFVSRNVIREIARRFKRAVVGREPRWAFVPRDSSVLEPATPPTPEPPPAPPNPLLAQDTGASKRAADRRKQRAAKKKKVPDELQKTIDEVSRSMTLWWDERGVHEIFQAAVTSLQMPAGRAGLRLYVPDGFKKPVPVVTDGIAPGGTRVTRKVSTSASLDDALAKLYPEHPLPTNSYVYEDPGTKRRIAIVAYKVADESNASGKDVIELSYLDKTGEKTIARTIVGNDEQNAGGMPIELGGRLLMNEVKMEPIITEQMIELQRAVNLALTMVPRNNVTAGFLSRIITNAKLPGYWEVDAQNKRTGKYIVTEFPTFGAGMTNVIAGQEVVQKDGTRNLTPVGVHESQPVDPTPTLRSYNGMYEAMLEEGEQDHILNRSADNANSGRSQEQGRSGFESANDEIATRVNRLGRWFMETALACAETLMGKPGFYTSRLRCVFECRTKVGPVSPDQQNAWLAAWEKGAIAKETMQEAIGINDTDAENDKIDNQQGGPIETITRQANAFKMLIDSTLGADVAGEIVKFDPDLLDRIAQSAAEQQQIKAQQLQAQLDSAEKIAETGASANRQQSGPGRPSGNRDPRARQGLTKTTAKQITPRRARPTPPQ